MKAFPAIVSPYSSVRAWFAALEKLDGLKPAVVVPSHGPTGDISTIVRYREYFRSVQNRARDLKAQKKSTEEASTVIQAEMQAKYPNIPQPAQVKTTVQIAFKETP